MNNDTCKEILQLLSENWFLSEPAFFALYCQHQLVENLRMECVFRCGQGKIEYNPLLLAHKNYAEAEQLMRIELIRLFLKHPYERQPEGCSREAMAIGSDVTIADGYCMLHKEKLPLRDPGFYHLPLGQYYEWYAKAVQNLNDDERRKNDKHQQNDVDQSSSNYNSGDNSSTDHQQREDADRSGLWQEDSMQRQRINDLIERTTDWGTLPSDIVERIKASTRKRIDNRLIWQGFHSAVISCHRELTRMRPNRRTGFIQMGSKRQYDTRLLIAIDTSGSITTDVLSDFYGCVNRLFRFGNTQIDVCLFDAEIHEIVPMQRANNELVVHGRGGTSFQPVFDYVVQHPNTYDGLLILTDGQAPPPQFAAVTDIKKHVRIPVLWVCDNHQSYEASHEWMRQSGRCCHL